MESTSLSFDLDLAIVATFDRLVEKAPEAPAVIDGRNGRMVTREMLRERAEQIAGWIAGHGVTAGSLIGVQLPNSADFVAAFLAVLRHRCTAISIDRDARDSEVGAILHHFDARALIYGSGEGDSLPQISLRPSTARLGSGSYVPLIKVTSGSTGLPKGVLASERSLIADCRNICLTMGILPQDRNLGAIPFSHSYGFSNLVTPLLLQGTVVVASNDYLPLSILNLANGYDCTVVPGIPMMFDHLANLPRNEGGFDFARTFISAGAPLAPNVSIRFRERFASPIHSFYGCSECGGIAYDRDGGAVEEGIVGAPMEGVEIAIDSNGRLSVGGDAVTSGYLHAAQDDEQKFIAGRFVTDDLGRMTRDGRVALVGRVGDLINTAGKKVNPREVENLILQIEGVREVKVYGAPAGTRGEVVAAAVVADPDVTRERIRHYCREHLSAHKVPRIVKMLETMPTDERGKIKRSELLHL